MPRDPFRTLLLIALVTAASAVPAAAQATATLASAENFRREPNGVVLARLSAGTTVTVLAEEGNWTQITLGGWVWLASVDGTDRDGFDLIVSVTDGENLRAAPAGDIIGRLEEGALLDEMERDVSWARVQRSGWIWTESLATPSAPTSAPAAPAEATRPGGFSTVGSAGGAILTAPDGDTLAMAAPDQDVQVVGREGSWVRVRVEGWMWMPNADVVVPDGGAAPEALTPADLAADPDGYVGRVVQWPLQFISLERAEAVRTDFFEGEPFLLARYGDDSGDFVYVPVPAERLPDVQGLVPLERVNVTGRVRTGASALTSTPIIDLISLERAREDP